MLTLFLVLAALAALAPRCGPAPLENVALDPGFEMAPTDPSRPRYWLEGFVTSIQSYTQRGSWAYDTQFKTEGQQSLRISPASNTGYRLSQVLNAPAHDLGSFGGRRVEVRIDIRHEGLIEPPLVQIVAFNRTLPAHPELGMGTAGDLTLVADGPEGSFQTYQGAFRGTDEAQALMAVISTRGTTGSVWVDDFRVEMVVPKAAPPSVSLPNPHGFKRAFAQESPRNLSERGVEDLFTRFATTSEVVNIISHVQWTALTGDSVPFVHRDVIRAANLARDAGLEVMLTFDFTHDLPETVGDVNTLSSREPVGSLNDPTVSGAILTELVALHDLVLPEYLMLGIEMDILYYKNPGQWPGFVQMFKDAATALKLSNPDVHVSSYFELQWMVDPQTGLLVEEHADLWRQLLPELESIAFSIYPGLFEFIFNIPPFPIPEDFFAAAQQVAPGLPYVIPEFGSAGATGAAFDESDQAAIFQEMLDQLAPLDVEVATWYSAHDQLIFGEVPWFEGAFEVVGMRTQNDQPKQVWYMWRGESPP